MKARGRAAAWKNGARWAASLAVAAVFLAPLLWMALASFRGEARIFQGGWGNWFTLEDWTAANYTDAWRRAALGRALAVSVAQVAVICGAGLLVNAMAAYAFARLEFRGREWLLGAVVALIILPVEVLVVPLFFTVRDLGLSGGFGAVMAALCAPFVAKAFNIYFLRAHFLALPGALEEAAEIDGAGAWRKFWSVALPSVRPALATVVLLDVLAHWGDFLWPLLVSTREETRTAQVGLSNLFTQAPLQWGQILACAVMVTLPVVALFRFFQRYIVASDAGAGIK